MWRQLVRQSDVRLSDTRIMPEYPGPMRESEIELVIGIALPLVGALLFRWRRDLAWVPIFFAVIGGLVAITALIRASQGY